MKFIFNFLKIVFISIFFCSPVSTFCQNDTLGLREVIDRAIKNNYNIALSKSDIKKSESSLSEIKTTRYPSLFGVTHYLLAPPGYNEAVTNNGEYGIQLSTNYLLYDGGARDALIFKANIDLEHSSLSLQKTKSEIAFQVKLLYYQIHCTNHEIVILKESAERFKEYLQLLQQLKRGGIAAESDISKAQIEFNNNLVEIDGIEQELVKLKFAMNNLLGQQIDKNLEIIEKNDRDAIPEISSTIDQSLDMKIIQNEAQSAFYDLQKANTEKYPSITVGGDIGYLGVTPAEFHQDKGFSVALNVSVPLFLWGAIDNRIEQAKITHDQALTKIDIQKRELQTQRLTLLNDIDLTKRNIVNYKNNIGISEVNYIRALARFKGGSGSNLEVLEAHRLIVESKINYNKSIYQLKINLAGLLHLQGIY